MGNPICLLTMYASRIVNKSNMATMWLFIRKHMHNWLDPLVYCIVQCAQCITDYRLPGPTAEASETSANMFGHCDKEIKQTAAQIAAVSPRTKVNSPSHSFSPPHKLLVDIYTS